MTNILKLFSLIYFAEKESAARWSFPESFWWGLMVLTTVGIGEKSPDSLTGQVNINVNIGVETPRLCNMKP